jgi:uncharacterized hydrophobic protein (TIGR00271 family)
VGAPSSPDAGEGTSPARRVPSIDGPYWGAPLIKLRLSGELRTPDEIRDAVYLFGPGPGAGAKQSRFWLLLVLAAVIATAGVISDSTATVIGAMIIAPLAVPIQGVGVAMAYGELRPLLLSLAIVAGAVVAVIGLACLLAVVLPDLHPVRDNSQIAGRASPTIVDLVVAAATGFAAAFAVARRDVGDILPGVAIAISLVPPLAVVGVAGVAGEWDSAGGAFLLFLTNVLAIVVVAIAVFSSLQLRQARGRDPAFRTRPVYSVVAVSAGVVVIALGIATYRTVELSDWRGSAQRIASAWARDHGERLVLARFDGDTLVLVVEGLTDGAHDAELPGLLQGELPDGTPVEINRIAGRRQAVGTVGE